MEHSTEEDHPLINYNFFLFSVLAELDSLKTMNERARECIRWLDRTISNGSPFLRTQEIRERLPIVDYQKPRHGASEFN